MGVLTWKMGVAGALLAGTASASVVAYNAANAPAPGVIYACQADHHGWERGGYLRVVSDPSKFSMKGVALSAVALAGETETTTFDDSSAEWCDRNDKCDTP